MSSQENADKPAPPAPMPRDKRGWRVAPAPDGRGMPDEHKPTPPHRWRGFWIFLVVLLAFNWLSVLLAQPGKPRVQVPFSPYFLKQLDAGHVKSITATSGPIQGTWTVALKYPADDKKATATEFFSTQIPSFWNTQQLTQELESKGVEVNAKNPNPGTSLLAELLLGFGPTLLLVGCSCSSPAARRAARRRPGRRSGNFGRSQARRVDPQKIRVTFADVAGIDEAKAELTEIVDFLKTPERYRAPGRPDAAWRAALRPAGHRQDAACPRGGRRGARRVLLDRGVGVHRGDRRGRRRARARPVRQGQGGGAGDHLHRRARRDRPLAPGLGSDHRRERRARADARSDPDRDGRLRLKPGGRRPWRHQSPGDPRPGAAAARALRPPCRDPAA